MDWWFLGLGEPKTSQMQGHDPYQQFQMLSTCHPARTGPGAPRPKECSFVQH